MEPFNTLFHSSAHTSTNVSCDLQWDYLLDNNGGTVKTFCSLQCFIGLVNKKKVAQNDLFATKFELEVYHR